jgi:hypothetical protein
MLALSRVMMEKSWAILSFQRIGGKGEVSCLASRIRGVHVVGRWQNTHFVRRLPEGSRRYGDELVAADVTPPLPKRPGGTLGQACVPATAVLTPALTYLRLLLMGTTG